ncbi:MAG: GNAT family N-acetyltransferase, partial [Gammaproteobacteria bacterium]|nr:GNAT family N-acetyltransferase [Gammaproteobacteria bacterium]
ADNGEIGGDCGLTYQSVAGVPELEIGYHVLASHRRRGYALEAARAAMQHGFAHTDAEAIYSIVAPDNEASIRVAVQLHRSRGEFVNDKGMRRLYFSTERSQFLH